MSTARVSEFASAPAFIGVILVNLAKMSEILQVMTLTLGCAISLVMLRSWCHKERRERANERLAEINLEEAEKRRRKNSCDE